MHTSLDSRLRRSAVEVFSFLLIAGGLPGRPVQAQVEQWKVGEAGLSWGSQAQVQAGLVTDGIRLHPLELVIEQNLSSQLNWLEGQPAKMTLEGNPRVWDNSGTSGAIILVDGKDTTSTGDRFQKNVSQAGRAFFFDLGVAFPINRIRFYPHPDYPELTLKAFEIFSSDGQSFTDIGQPVYQSIKRVEFNESPVVDVRFPSKPIRFLQLRTLSRDAFALSEFEIYGEGFVPNSSYLSQLHEFAEGPVNFGRLLITAALLRRGSEIQANAATARIQVRSGADDTPLTYFRRDRENGTETEVSESEYKSLIVYEQGPVREDGDNWSPWSAPVRIDASGILAVPLDLPSPRQYLQFHTFFSGEPTQAIQLDQLTVEYSVPLVEQAMGELALASNPAPLAGVVRVPAGVETTFVYDIRARFNAATQEGFKGVRLASFPPPRFVGLEIGSPLTAVVPDSLVLQEDGFVVYFPPVTDQNNSTLRMTIKATLFEYTTRIDSWLVGVKGGLPHPVLAGNASGEIQTSSLEVQAASTKPGVSLELSSAVFTPNGDRVNDTVEFSYLLTQFSSQILVRLEVYDLSGRRVKTFLDGEQATGKYEQLWDGSDEQGERVAPGIYMCLLVVDADARSFLQTRIVGVAY